jgi:glycine cleavage system H protein
LDTPSDLRYSDQHAWARQTADGLATVGLTDFGQDLLGEIVYVELPHVGATVTRGEPCCVVESVKAVSEFSAPLSGEVIAVNSALADAPETVNRSPYDDGSLFQVRYADASELTDMLDAEAYIKISLAR